MENKIINLDVNLILIMEAWRNVILYKLLLGQGLNLLVVLSSLLM